ncbi:E3 ubiquitin-protein ligase makorin-1-like [Erinaceus europaeus]|uniref:RING-type E3 ubiquitin transferase n=1 Tax=Erinaceus europaeus TaxID=9365 RepID=A0A1S3WP33_ERIEU|nr:E3 ubiquitin-protein ligase makorin-1-like [Erinaceus europaeus]
MAPLQKLSREKQQREQDSRDIVCGICMDKVWDKPKAQRVFGILPNCTHAHCLGCLRSWRKRRQDFPRDVIKACPQCRVHSSYVIPCQFWVSEGAEKEQLIQSFKAWTSQIPCRFFAQGSRHCPFKSDCIYLHQLQAKAPRSTSLPASRSEVVLEPPAFLQCADLEHELRFVDYAMDVVFWYSELLLNPYSFYRNLQCPRSLCRGWGQQASRLC